MQSEDQAIKIIGSYSQINRLIFNTLFFGADLVLQWNWEEDIQISHISPASHVYSLFCH